MEISTGKWFSELVMEDFFYPDQMNPIDPFDNLNFQSFSSDIYTPPNISVPQPEEDVKIRPAKQLKTHHNSCNSDPRLTTTTITDPPKTASSSFSQIISFHNHSDSSPAVSAQQPEQYLSANICESVKKVSSATRSPLSAQDHVIAERKRREKLSQRFIALSALVPGLKKTDKASILGDAIKYLKQMEECVKSLQEQVAKKTVESVVFVKKTQVYYTEDDQTSSSDENFNSNSKQPLPEIEAKVSDRDVLIKIHCEKRKGCAANIMKEIEKLHLAVVTSSVLPFGNTTLDITVVAKMEVDFAMTVRDLVKNLRQVLLK